MSAAAAGLPPERLRELEATAVELARLAGAEIRMAFGRTLAVRYKTGSGDEAARLADPVPEADQRVEDLLRERLAERFPDHGITGEEGGERSGGARDTVWTVDPIDGTSNFVAGFPLFAASVGVLHRGVPVAGGLLCAEEAGV